MTWRQLWRAAAISLASAIASAVLLFAGARWVTPPVLEDPLSVGGWVARTPGWIEAGGFLDSQIDPGTRRVFRWTGGGVRLFFPALDRSQSYRLTFDVLNLRPADRPPPAVTAVVDGTRLPPRQVQPGPSELLVTIPVNRGAGAKVLLEIPDTVVSGGNPQAHGILVGGIRLQPDSGHFRPAAAGLLWTGLAVALCVFGVLIPGLQPRWAPMVATAIVVAFVWLLTLDAAFYGDYLMRLVHIGVGVAIIGAIGAVVRARWPLSARLPEWPTALGVVLAVSAVKLAFFTHPQIALTDAMFQVHRAEAVHRGEYFFTSVTPSPSFEFPYAIALYVAAQPFWSSFPTNPDLANLLRGLALGADALVGLGLYVALRRAWQNDRVAILAAAIWPLTRAPAMALGHANLTNLFGQGLFGVAMAMVLWMMTDRRASVLSLISVWGVLVLAFLSHFSTLSVGLLLLASIATTLLVVGGPELRRTGGWVLVVTAAAFGLSYVVYYSHFTALYKETLTRLLSGADEQTATSMVAAPALKLQRWLTEDQFSNDYGLPGIALFASACLGGLWLVRAGWRQGITLALMSWAAVWVCCSALGILSSVELRANLAATPMFVCLSAYGLGALAARSRLGAALSAIWLVAIAWDGVHVWLFWLGRA